MALLGENGAGKSTLSNIISGTVQPSSGEMTWLGAPYAPANPRARDGCGRRDDPPGTEAAAAVVHRRERLRRPLSDEGRPHRPQGDGRTCAARACNGWAWTYRPRALVRWTVDREPATDRDRQGADAERPNAHPRRADGGAWRRRDAASVPPDRTADRPTASASSTFPTGWRKSARSPTASSSCATAPRCRNSTSGDVPVRTIVEAMVGRSLDRMFPCRSRAEGRRDA